MDTLKSLAKSVAGELSGLVKYTRAKLARIGRNLDDYRLAMPRVKKNPSDDKSDVRDATREECIEHIGTMLLTENIAFNDTLAKKAFTILDDAREASKRGVYEAWKAAETDVAADALIGKMHAKKAPDSFLVKLAKLLDKATPADLEGAKKLFAATEVKLGATSVS